MTKLEIADVRYVAVAKKSGERLCEPTSYATAAQVALWTELDRREEIADAVFATAQECADAVDDCVVGVVFHSSTPRATPEALAKLEGPFRYASGWMGYYDPSAGRYLNMADLYEPVGFDPGRAAA